MEHAAGRHRMRDETQRERIDNRKTGRQKPSRRREPSYKPGSVPLRVAVIHLGRRLPNGSSNLPGSVGRASPLPYLVLLQTGFAWLAVSLRRPVGSYSTLSPLPAAEAAGGLLSVALSRDRSLWALPSVLPCEARTFLPAVRRGDSPFDSRNFTVILRFRPQPSFL